MPVRILREVKTGACHSNDVGRLGSWPLTSRHGVRGWLPGEPGAVVAARLAWRVGNPRNCLSRLKQRAAGVRPERRFLITCR